jgi:predicted glycoside hydrolase/deacetylase ChbG (UPF0249 family)
MPERFILCADDFALSRGISETIASLAASGSINAVSCMVPFANWEKDAPLLVEAARVRDPRHGPLHVGLHLTLSSERPITRMSCTDADGRLPGADALMVMAHRRKLDLTEFRAEIDAQIAAFVAVRARRRISSTRTSMSMSIRACAKWWSTPCWNTRRTPGCATRRPAGGDEPAAVHRQGDRIEPPRGRFPAAASRRGVASNRSFGGHYDFTTDYAALLPRFFAAPSDMHVVMCHPGAGHLDGDTIADARIREASVLAAAALPERLARIERVVPL